MRVEMAMLSMKKKCFIFALVLCLIIDVGFGGGVFVIAGSTNLLARFFILLVMGFGSCFPVWVLQLE